MTINAAHDWNTNGDLIADVAQLYPMVGLTFDATYGQGGFWTKYRPEILLTNDINEDTDADLHHDFTALPFEDKMFHNVVFDPPYKLTGTPSLGDFDTRYGIVGDTSWQQRMHLIYEGAVECSRVTYNHLFVKCQDQVASGKVRWQTLRIVTALSPNFRLLDRFDMLGGGRPQPAGRRQVHAHNRPSTLLVLERYA